ncbi:MAG TPA: gamma-glutamyltransferase [Gaiellaceae bacterium]|jgi:gamma-glutamyltranspeptidase / glutathione hydrolase
MRGAIAAGHKLTAEAGAEILAEGGNAVDACLAAAFASWVAESPLTGPAAGGFLLVHRARDRTDRLLDFFVALPGRGSRKPPEPHMESIDIDFDGSSSQVFLIGTGSCAVPGALAGLEAAHGRYASLPWRRLLEPAIALARGGVELTPQQAYLHAILDLILRHAPEGRAIYGEEGRVTAGERIVMHDLASTLELLADGGARQLYHGELGRTIVHYLAANGGLITPEDLAAYRVIWRRPIRVPYKGHEFVSNPPPSSGGILIGYGLSLLDLRATDGRPGSASAIEALVEVMREQSRARAGSFTSDLYRGGLARRLYAGENLRAALLRMERGENGGSEPAGASGTTHISVVDEHGNAASMTASIGAGSGVVVPGTGIHMNNMLGEYDLNPPDRSARTGERLTSMMAPSIALDHERPRLVVGSAGSIRLRGAILQIVVNVVHHGMAVEEAIEAPRVHFDDGHVHCEGGSDPAELDRLEARGYDLVRWRRRNLYFGGAAAVERRADGSLAAAGDPRRGGHGIVVPR